jgi:serine/threonine-protein kinase RsbW
VSRTGAVPGPPPGNQEEFPGSDLERLLEEDPADLYENAPCGYLSTLPDGTLVKVNRTFCAWVGRGPGELLGRRFQDLLAPGSRLFFETHLRPLLRMQGAVREIALDVTHADGAVLPCLLNAVEVRGPDGAPLLIRSTLFDATARRRYERELLAAQRAAEESESRARTLQQVVLDLAAAVSTDDVATVIVERSRRALGAAGAALLLVGDPAARVPAPRLGRSAGLSAELVARIGELAAEWDTEEFTGDVRRISLDAALRAARPALAEALAGAAVPELLLVPVSADERLLGVLVLAVGAAPEGALIALDEPPPTELPETSVELLRTLGRQAGQALERARLHEETARQAARAAFLVDAARLLAGAEDVREMVSRLAELTVTRLADVCMIDLVADQGIVRQAARHGDPARQGLVDELLFRHVPAEQRLPSVRAFLDARTEWIPELRDDEVATIAIDERHAAVLRALQVRSLISVPLIADNRPLGVITLWGDRRRRPFTESDVEVVEQLALQLALVVDKAQRYETDVRASHTLQANLLPPPAPVVEGLVVAVRYLPATRGVEIGGDFYDVVQLAGGPVALAVGDVVGHDITAAATMGQLRSVYRALLVDRPTPSAVIDRLQASWSLLDLQRMATALFATLDPTTGQLHIASAGHVAPLVVAGDRAEYLPVRPSRMLGAPPVPAVEWAGVLRRGETLLLFTDGLVESREADLDAGLARLRETARRNAGGTPDQLCDRLLAELAGAHRADDIALVALTRRR